MPTGHRSAWKCMQGRPGGWCTGVWAEWDQYGHRGTDLAGLLARHRFQLKTSSHQERPVQLHHGSVGCPTQRGGGHPGECNTAVRGERPTRARPSACPCAFCACAVVRMRAHAHHEHHEHLPIRHYPNMHSPLGCIKKIYRFDLMRMLNSQVYGVTCKMARRLCH